MATTAQRQIPHVSLFTDHEKKCVKILIAGEHGTLGLEAYAEDPLITIPDPDRGPMKLYAICALEANGRLKGWFIEKKGATVRDDTRIFFPARKRQKRSAKTRKNK